VRPLAWVGASREDLRRFPEEAKDELGYGLFLAQVGDKHPGAKPLKGFRGAGVLEIVADVPGATYRVVYTVRLKNAVYVLHAFQKKSRHGIATPRGELDMIRQRLKRAEEADAEAGSAEKS
jgi:phage-related protein